MPPADAGLGSGIVNVSQQVAGALGLAVLGTIAADHTHALQAARHPVSDSLIAGYHLAFTVGAASVAVGILIAIALLRAPTPAQADMPVLRERADVRLPEPELGRQAV